MMSDGEHTVRLSLTINVARMKPWHSLQAMLMREGAGLSDQNQQNLTALVQGREEDPDVIARALGRMDVICKA